MKLGDWLEAKGLTQTAFAALIGSDQAHVSDLVRGKNRPRLDTVVAIEKATGGAVKAEDWMQPKRVRVEKLRQAVRKAGR